MSIDRPSSSTIRVCSELLRGIDNIRFMNESNNVLVIMTVQQLSRIDARLLQVS